MVTEIDIAWLAGLLEGEGCFGIQKVYKRFHPRVDFKTTDLDVLRKAQRLMLSNALSIETRSRYKKYYITSVSGAVAISLMKKILPHMGERRTQRINEIISIYESQPPKVGRSR